ncbi:hypothetical protein BASA81_003372 [Batrachochytrium salamandrivorans]|nr:hypothetical protein BASA81_003372 [Batrachochytrium salamandrivorans]
MLSFSSKVVQVSLDHSISILSENAPPTATASKAQLAGLTSKDQVVSVCNHQVLLMGNAILTRSRYRASGVMGLQLRILPPPAIPALGEEEDDEEEVWVLWSDSTLSRTRLGGTRRTVMYETPSGALFDFVLFPRPPQPYPPLGLVASRQECSKWLVVAISSTEVLSLHVAHQNAHSKQKTLFAVSATSAFTSLVSSFARRYLLPEEEGGEAEERGEEETAMQDLSICCSFADHERREFRALAKGGDELFALADSLGRVLVLHAATFQVLKMLKGYRDAQLAFHCQQQQPGLPLLLAVYSPQSRGDRIELWVASSNAGSKPWRFASVPANISLAANAEGTKLAVCTPEQGCIPVIVDLPLIAGGPSAAAAAVAGFVIDKPAVLAGNEVPNQLLKLSLEEWEAHCGDLGIDFLLQTLGHRPDWLDSLKRITPLARHLSKLVNHPPALYEDGPHPIRAWIKPPRKEEENAEWFPSRDLDLFIIRYLRHGLDCDFVVQFAFNVLLLGDIFAVRELQTFFSGGGDYSKPYIRWWLDTRVECANQAWKNSSLSTVSLAKYLAISFANAKDLAVEWLEEMVSDQVQLARACLLYYALQHAEALARFTKLFRRAEQLGLTNLTCHELESADFLIARCLEFSLANVDQRPVFVHGDDDSSSLDSKWFKPTVFSDELARDEFRLQVAHELVSHHQQFSACHRILSTEMEADGWCGANQGRHGLWDACVEQCTISHGVLNSPDLQNLMLFLGKREDAVRRSLAEAVVLAFQESFGKRLDLVDALCEPDEVYCHSPAHQDLLLELLGHVALNQAEDEQLRRVGLRIGIDSPDQVCHKLALGHAFRALDQRAIECFDKFISDQAKSACASELLLTVAKQRCVLYVKRANNSGGNGFASALAKWNPKTVAWLTSKSATAAVASAEANGLKLATIPSTRLLLSKILPFLPSARKPDELAATTSTTTTRNITSHHDRCLELLTLTESLLQL